MLAAAELRVAKAKAAVMMAERAKGWMDEAEREEQEEKAFEELKLAEEEAGKKGKQSTKKTIILLVKRN